MRGLALGCRLALVVGAMTLLAATTKPLDLAHGLGWLFGPFRSLRPSRGGARHGDRASRSALSRFWAKRPNASGSPRKPGASRSATARSAGPPRSPSIVVPLFAGALRHADELGMALEARGYRPRGPAGATLSVEGRPGRCDLSSSRRPLSRWSLGVGSERLGLIDQGVVLQLGRRHPPTTVMSTWAGTQTIASRVCSIQPVPTQI